MNNEHLLIDIQTWSLGCVERDMTDEKFADEEENFAHMELDKYLMDLLTMMEVDSEDEGEWVSDVL